jgi:DNA (cytosine-5)-methyltransferase 1
MSWGPAVSLPPASGDHNRPSIQSVQAEAERSNPEAAIRDLSHQLLTLGDGPEVDLRAAVRNAVLRVPDETDQWWQTSRIAPEGPVDVIDAFSGCGGMSAGFRSVNGLIPAFRLAAAVDINETANRTYESNLALTPRADDVSRLAADAGALAAFVAESRRRTDRPLVLIGCAPCQGFSSHRNAVGAEDDRNTLFVDFAKIAAALRPAAVVMENVPELLTEKYWPHVAATRRILEGAGYRVHVGVHNVAEFGVPQERFRALILAMPKCFRPLMGILQRENFRTVRTAIGHLPPVQPGRPHPSDAMHESAGHKQSTLEVIRAVPRDGGNRPADVGPESLRRLAERQGRAAYEDVYGRLWWDRPSITITGSSRNPASGRFVHPEQDRALTVREAALLQGYPPDYRFEGTLDERFMQIGNAVPPRFAAALALHLLGEIFGPELPDRAFDKGIVKPLGSSFARMIPALKAGHLKGLLSCHG